MIPEFDFIYIEIFKYIDMMYQLLCQIRFFLQLKYLLKNVS
jgi:hypothetical protein